MPWKRLFAEVLAIVFGILLAFGIDALYEARVERERGVEYEHRIAAELRDLRANIELMARAGRRSSDYAIDVARLFYSRQEFDDFDWLVLALYNIGRDYGVPLDVSNYEDLVSTGSLALISNVDRRQAIQGAYARIQEVERSRYPHRDEYLTGIRGWIPQEFIDEIQRVCPDMGAEDWACPVIEFDDDVVEDIVRRTAADEAFLAFQLRRQGLDRLRRETGWAIDAIDAALDLLE